MWSERRRYEKERERRKWGGLRPLDCSFREREGAREVRDGREERCEMEKKQDEKEQQGREGASSLVTRDHGQFFWW